MKRLMILLLSAGYIACAPCLGHAAEETSSSVEPHGILHKLVMYVPNRVLDMLDVVRLRARVGPGVALNVRVTNLAAVLLVGLDAGVEPLELLDLVAGLFFIDLRADDL